VSTADGGSACAAGVLGRAAPAGVQLVGPDTDSGGPMQPRDLYIYAERFDYSAMLSGYDDMMIHSTRLMVLVNKADTLHVCVSPDLAAGQGIIVYSGDLDPPEDIGMLLDESMIEALDEAFWLTPTDHPETPTVPSILHVQSAVRIPSNDASADCN
jgi:hypothetical protein